MKIIDNNSNASNLRDTLEIYFNLEKNIFLNNRQGICFKRVLKMKLTIKKIKIK